MLPVAALRFAIAAVALSALLWIKEGRGAFIPQSPGLQIARGICLAFASLSFFSAIYLMPLAETMAIAFLAPIFTAILSGPMLGEKVRLPVWIASAIAMGGVMLVLRPNLELIGWPAILPVISAVFFSMMVVLNRKSAGQGSALSMQVFVASGAAIILSIAAIGAKLSGVPSLDFGWPDWDVVARCVIVAGTASAAHWLAFMGTMRAGASQVAPAVYVQLLVAGGLGWWWFDEVPDTIALLGAGVIIFAGLILWRHSLAQDKQSTRDERSV